MRFFFGRDESLWAGAVHVSQDVMGAPADLRSKTPVAGSPRANVSLAAVHGDKPVKSVKVGV